MAERFDIYSYEVLREGEAPETRYSFVPVRGTRYSGRDEPIDGNALSNDDAMTLDPEPAGTVEAPDGTMVATMEPPILEIPGHGRVDLLAVIGVGEGHAPELGPMVRWHPRRG